MGHVACCVMSSSSRGGGGGGGGISEVVIVSSPSRTAESVVPAAVARPTSSYDDETKQKGEGGISKTRECPKEDDKGTTAEDRRCSPSSEHQSQPTHPPAQSLQPHSATAGTKQTALTSSSITRLPPPISYSATPPNPTLLPPSPHRSTTTPHPSKSSSTAHLGLAPTTVATHPTHRPSSPEDDNEGHSSYSPLHPVRDFDLEPDMGQRSSIEYGLGSLSSLTMNIALTVGIVCGTVVLISVTIYALVRCGRPRGDPGCYKADPSSKYVYEACETTQAIPSERIGITPTPPSEQRTNPHKKYVNEWYV